LSHKLKGGVSWEIEDVKADMLRIRGDGRKGVGAGAEPPARLECFIAVTGRGMRGMDGKEGPGSGPDATGNDGELERRGGVAREEGRGSRDARPLGDAAPKCDPS
jgi:hypothetical protein